MRHRVAGRKLSLPTDQRMALLKGLVRNLILNEGIITTEPRAKEARVIAEKLITTAKKGWFGKDDSELTAEERAQKVHSIRMARRIMPAPKMPRKVLAMKGDKQKAAKAAIREHDAIKHLYEDICPRVADRKGGYTRITKVGFRRGDNASLVKLELVLD